jgi:hypothetical protein
LTAIELLQSIDDCLLNSRTLNATLIVSLEDLIKTRLNNSEPSSLTSLASNYQGIIEVMSSLQQEVWSQSVRQSLKSLSQEPMSNGDLWMLIDELSHLRNEYKS